MIIQNPIQKSHRPFDKATRAMPIYLFYKNTSPPQDYM